VDLALDLVVSKSGEQYVLDMDEFTVLEMNPNTRKKALAALYELQDLFNDHPDGIQIMNWSEMNR
jgi:predicted RNA-binding protein associated with RNAse of E/G family